MTEQTTHSATPSTAIRKTLRRWAYAAGYIESELDTAADRMYAAIARDIAAQRPSAGQGKAHPAPDAVAAIVAALQKRADELSDLADEQMRPSLEERAQEWREAAETARRTGREARP